MTSRTAALVAVAVMLSGSPVLAAPPAWLRQAAAAPAGPQDPAAIVLLDHVDATVSDDGKLRVTRRYAMRLRDREGRGAASMREVYATDGGKIRELRGWLIRAAGETRDLGASHIADLALVDNDVYNEVRVRILNATDEIAPGDVFGAEVETEQRLLFAQLEWRLQDRWPVRVARRTLTLPPGWTAKSLTFNRAPIEARTEAGTLAWEVQNLPALPAEELMPPASDLVPRLAVSVFGSPSAPAPGQFASWADVAAWLQNLSPQTATPTDAVGRKAHELAADGRSELERILAIARFVQRVQYVSIQTGLGRGGGYVPRPADTVLQRNYGDCKDKANLMRAMLAALGISSHMVSVFSGDRNYVRAEWPSPQQFNHAIVAVRLSEAADVATVLPHAKLGRLLIFDPTDSFTPLGELPADEQGSFALIEAGPASVLERLPIAPGSTHRIVRTVEGRVGPQGELVVRIKEEARGSEAAARRAAFSALDANGYRGMMQDRLASIIPGARVVQLNPDPGSDAASFTTTAEVAAAGYAQPMGQLLLVKPPLDVGYRAHAPRGGVRQTPIVIQPRYVDETVTLEIPSGFSVDELPLSTSFESSFGRYSLTYSVEARRITARRSFEVQLKTVPVAEYDAVRAFFDKVRTADASPIVLKG
jgi:transglutaminase-like putative cysteine protease